MSDAFLELLCWDNNVLPKCRIIFATLLQLFCLNISKHNIFHFGFGKMPYVRTLSQTLGEVLFHLKPFKYQEYMC